MSDHRLYWEVHLECIAEDSSRYTFVYETTVSPNAGTPLEAADQAMEHAVMCDETPCGIEKVVKHHDE